MIGCGDGDGINIFVFEELANIDVGFRLWHAEFLDVAEALVQYVFVDVAESGKFCSGYMRKAADVIVAATSHTANCHSDAIICAEDLASERECGRADSYCFSGRLEKFAPLDCHNWATLCESFFCTPNNIIHRRPCQVFEITVFVE